MSKPVNQNFSGWGREIARTNPERKKGNHLLSINDLIEKLGVSRQTIWKMRKKGALPEGRKLPGSNLVRWSESTIDEWMRKEGF